MIPEINLLPRDEKPSQRPIIISSIIFILWILLVVYFVYQYILINGEQHVLKTRINSLTLEKEIYSSQVQVDPRVSQAALTEAADLLQYLTVPSSIVMNELKSLLTTGGTIEDYSFTNGLVDMELKSSSLPAISEFYSRLVASPVFNNIYISTIYNNTDENNSSYTAYFSFSVNSNVLLNLTGGGASE